MTIVSESGVAHIRAIALGFKCKRDLAHDGENFAEYNEAQKILYEVADILERLMECRVHIIPHKHDAEIIDYIVTGARYDDTTK